MQDGHLKSRTARVERIGDELMVRLTSDAAADLGVREGDEIEIRSASTASTAPEGIADRVGALHALRKYRGIIPAGYKFDRDELHQRGSDVKD